MASNINRSSFYVTDELNVSCGTAGVWFEVHHFKTLSSGKSSHKFYIRHYSR